MPEDVYAHIGTITRLTDLGLLEHTDVMDRSNMTDALLRGHCVVIVPCTCGKCKPPGHFQVFATFKGQDECPPPGNSAI
jgi:hypothetical protein